MKPAPLSIIIVNYNSRRFLSACLRSLTQFRGDTAFRVVVVDNASEDQDFGDLRRDNPEVLFLLNSENRGFSAACNQGIREIDADLYLFLNPDCEVNEGTIDRCADYLRKHPDIGVLGCRVTNPDGSLQLACRRRIPRPSSALYRLLGLSILFPRSKRLAAYNMTYMPPSETHEVEAVSGSFLMFRRSVLDSVGLMDEDYFLYGEDLDFCYRAHRSGWKVVYFADAQVTHYKGMSGISQSRMTLFHYHRSMEIFYRKHYGREAPFLQNWAVVAAIRILYQWKRLMMLLRPGRRIVSER